MKRVVTGSMVMAVVVLVSGCSFIPRFDSAKRYKKNPSLATYDGSLNVSGLRGEVNVYRDQYGIPHIFTEDEHDLFFAVGYVQAQDRLWGMTLLRAIAEGRMSELFGDIGVPGSMEAMGYPLSTFKIDKRQRIMGMKWIGDIGEELLKEVNPEIYEQLQAYCDGVNAFIETHLEWEELPVEFQALRTRPQPWRVADIVSFGRFIGSMLSGNMDLELLRYGIIKKYGPEMGWQLVPLHDALGPTIVPPELLKNKLSSPRGLPPGGRPTDDEIGYDLGLSADAALALMVADSAIKKALYVKSPLASNNWVVSGKLTKSGNAMLANDPHLQHVEPSLFYLMRLKGAGIDAYGASFPGTPYIVLGHTRKLAWGATTSIADVQDLFIETVDKSRPGMYKYKGEWRPFTIRKEIIRVRVGSRLVDREIEIRQSIHGPIINEMADLPEDTPPIAMRWVGWDFDRDPERFKEIVQLTTIEEAKAHIKTMSRDFEIRNIAIMYNHLLRGESIDDFLKAMDMIVLPNQSWVAADADGHIAYFPGGLVPIRNKGVGVMPVPGESGEYDWKGFIPVMELPHVIDPERGYMATANNEVVDAEWYPYVFATNYGESWRAWRIEELIEELAPLDMNDMRRIQNDVLVKQAEWEIPIILKAVENKNPSDPQILRAADELKNWDYLADLDATAPVIFFQFIKELKRNVLEDEMPKKDYRAFLGGHMTQVIHQWMRKGESQFFDDKRTPDVVEDMDDMLVKSLGDAMAWVEKKYGTDPADREWGKVHWIKWYNLMGWGPLKELSVGPFPHLGASGTIRNAGTAGFGKAPYKCLGGPVLRHIMDMGDPDHALMVIDGSQSGQWLSPHYDDMHQLWLNSEYVTATMDPEKVKRDAKYHLVLNP